MSDMVLQRVTQILADLCDVPQHQITSTTTPSDIPAWDSVQHLNLMLELEQAYGIKIDLEEMAGMQTVGTIATIVETKIPRASA